MPAVSTYTIQAANARTVTLDMDWADGTALRGAEVVNCPTDDAARLHEYLTDTINDTLYARARPEPDLVAPSVASLIGTPVQV